MALHPSKHSPLVQPLVVTDSHHRQVDESFPTPPNVPSRHWLPNFLLPSAAPRPKPAHRFQKLSIRSPRPQGFAPHHSPLLNPAFPPRCCHLSVPTKSRPLLPWALHVENLSTCSTDRNPLNKPGGTSPPQARRPGKTPRRSSLPLQLRTPERTQNLQHEKYSLRCAPSPHLLSSPPGKPGESERRVQRPLSTCWFHVKEHSGKHSPR